METLVSVVIIEIVSVALVSMLRTSSRVNEVSRSNDAALDMAIEIATNHDNDEIVLGTESAKFSVVLGVKYSQYNDPFQEDFDVNVYGSMVDIPESGTETEDDEKKSVKKLLQLCSYVYPATY